MAKLYKMVMSTEVFVVAKDEDDAKAKALESTRGIERFDDLAWEMNHQRITSARDLTLAEAASQPYVGEEHYDHTERTCVEWLEVLAK